MYASSCCDYRRLPDDVVQLTESCFLLRELVWRPRETLVSSKLKYLLAALGDIAKGGWTRVAAHRRTADLLMRQYQALTALPVFSINLTTRLICVPAPCALCYPLHSPVQDLPPLALPSSHVREQYAKLNWLGNNLKRITAYHST